MPSLKECMRCMLPAALVVTVTCARESTAPLGDKIMLTEQQASVLSDRAAQIATVHPELQWLADSIAVVLHSGAEAVRVAITTDLGNGPFWAVGLQRVVLPPGGNAYSTFGFIAFDNPDAPGDFIIVCGYKAGSPAPSSVTGTFASGVELSGHFIHSAGEDDAMKAWQAAQGAGTLSEGEGGGPCPGFVAANGTTCELYTLNATFAITVSLGEAGSASGSKMAILGAVEVPGVRLTIAP